MSHRSKIRQAFADLRKQGFVARMTLLCCSSCALSKLTSDGVKEGDDFVFFHRQDAEAFAPDGSITRMLPIRWGGDASKILEALTRQSLCVSWDGSSSKVIEVLP